MWLLDPAVIALGFLLYEKYALLWAYTREMALALIPASVLSLFSSALGARLLHISREYALSLLPRSVTTPVAIPIAELLGANPGLTAALVVITGVLGAVFGIPVLDALKIDAPAARGIAIGASSHGIGTAALITEDPAAAAFSGVAFALMAAFSTAAVSIPSVHDALLAILGTA